MVCREKMTHRKYIFNARAYPGELLTLLNAICVAILTQNCIFIPSVAMKHLICLLLFLLTLSPALAQKADSTLLQDQNPNHKRSKDKYTKPLPIQPKEKPVGVLKDSLRLPATTTSTVPSSTTTAGTHDVYLKSLKKAEENFAAKGNYKDAYEISLLLKTANDSLASNEARRLRLQERLRYDSLRQAESVRAYENDLQQKQHAIESSKRVVYLVAAALVLVLLLALSFYRSYRNTKKNNRIIAEQKRETEEKNRIIAASLAEKETLLKEIHHRVKNNLQIVSSLLNLQAGRTSDENLKRIMNEAKNRIGSMALMHQKIYQSGNLSSVDFQAYLTQMAQSVDANFNNEKKHIVHHIETNGIVLDIDTSIPLGLIVNELLTNSYKYAFKGRNSGNIAITLKEKNAGELELHVADDGNGLPPGFDPSMLNSLGVKLIKGLAAQLKGTVHFENKGGTHCTIDFKNPATSSL